jgi:hypothetical protein
LPAIVAGADRERQEHEQKGLSSHDAALIVASMSKDAGQVGVGVRALPNLEPSSSKNRR